MDWEPADIARVLSHSRLFYGMPRASLLDLALHGRVEELDVGQTTTIRPNELRVILEGDLHMVLDGSILGRGNFFGETALLDLALAQELDAVPVQSTGGCTLLVLSAAEITAWLERHPHLQAGIYQHLSQELFNRCLGSEIPKKAA